MKLLSRLTLLNLICFVSFPAAADLVANQEGSNSGGSGDLPEYILNLGGYLGYDLKQNPSKDAAPLSTLIDKAATQAAQGYVLFTFLGAVPVDAVSAAMSQFLPTDKPGAAFFNGLANAVYKYQNYSNASNSNSNMTVNPGIDQLPYQQDPVSQTVMNILGTPDSSYCMTGKDESYDKDCSLLVNTKVVTNVIGPIPDSYTFYDGKNNQQLVGQLNSSSLTGPMMYSGNSNDQSTSSDPDKKENQGLTAQSQIQQAANFIRYASGTVEPTALPKLKDYDKVYNLAMPKTPTYSAEEMTAKTKLSTYFTSLRVYAAQTSVGVGNLYYILSKRLPQNTGVDTEVLSSQALNEFNMATRRLFNGKEEWIDKLNNASSVTVQKEIATLLAEINYQMYLDRQLQERILLTNSIMLLQNSKAAQPVAELGGSAGTPTE